MDANPPANFTWYKKSSLDGGAELTGLNKSALPIGFEIERDGEDSLLLVSFYHRTTDDRPQLFRLRVTNVQTPTTAALAPSENRDWQLNPKDW